MRLRLPGLDPSRRAKAKAPPPLPDNAYAFAAIDAQLIEDGARTFLLSPPARARHPRIGQMVHLHRLDGGKPIGSAPCVLRARLVLGPEGIDRVLDLKHSAQGERLARILQGAERSSWDAAASAATLARLDGFRDYHTLYAHHLAVDDTLGRRTPRRRVIRDVIGWAPLGSEGEPIRSLENGGVTFLPPHQQTR